jgi:hypothetical protein
VVIRSLRVTAHVDRLFDNVERPPVIGDQRVCASRAIRRPGSCHVAFLRRESPTM